MATTVKRKSTNNKSKLIKSSKVKWRYILPLLAIAVAAGIYLVFTSHAGSLPNRTSGYMDWRLQGTTRYTSAFKSTDGQVCVNANFNAYNVPPGTMDHEQYHWGVERMMNGKWQRIRESNWFRTNGDMDHQCFDYAIAKGGTYRVWFDLMYGRYGYQHGNYWVYGYHHN